MFINRSWMEFTHGEKMSVLEYAKWENERRWNMKKAAMAGS